MPVSPDEVLEFLGREARRPLSAREISAHFGSRISGRDLHRLLKGLLKRGEVIRLRGGRFSLPRQVNLVVGRVTAHRDGYGFLEPEEGGRDVFLPARTMRQVMDGDRVAVRVERSGERPEGRVVRVVERRRETVVGRYFRERRIGYLVPDDPRLTHDILIPPEGAGGARPGQVAIARIDAYPTPNRNPAGSIVEVLGDPGDAEVEIRTIAHKYELPFRFPAEVLEAAGNIPSEVRPAERAGRRDLRDLGLVTIDGESARDFDDAVAVRSEGDRFRLWVAIADVAHYVPEGGTIDLEAYARGTSVYFPGYCLPMLPESLSNGICSLNPQVDRLALAAELEFDRQGRRLSRELYPAVIRSRARLTYRQVQNALDGRPDPTLEEDLPERLGEMDALARLLGERRHRRGSLDFDLPEAEVVLNLRGRPEEILRAERTPAHQLIEEFMLAANEAVAELLEEASADFLFRIHERPDPERIAAFAEFLAPLGYRLTSPPEKIRPIDLQGLLRQAEGKPEERLVNHLLLRSLQKARYAPHNEGHFGLAAEHYCHFTSPIRRYPDLTVHRTLRRLWEGKPVAGRKGRLEEVGRHTSWRERQALEAEREILTLKKCQFMQERIGEEFAGVVASVQSFGFFVELEEFPVEGLVPLSRLADDFYDFEEESHRLFGRHRGRSFQVGQEVRVKVEKVDLERREIDFALVSAPVEEPAGAARRRPSETA